MRIAQMFLLVTPLRSAAVIRRIVFGATKESGRFQDAGAEHVDWVDKTPALTGRGGKAQCDRPIDKQGEVTYCLAG